MRHYSAEKIADLIAQPAPIGMDFKTSKAGLNRFREDFFRCAMGRNKREAELLAERHRIALDEAFTKAHASPEAFRQATEAQLRKRLFHASHDTSSDYHEIRWLIKSIEMLNHQSAAALSPGDLL